MRVPHLILILVLLPALTMACGSDDPGPKTRGAGPATIQVKEVDADLVRLLPEDTAVVLYVPSPLALAAKIRAMGAKVDPDEFGQKTDEQMFHMVLEEMDLPGLTPDMIDGDKPMALGASFVKSPRGEPQPMPVMILPVKDAEQARAVVREAMDVDPAVVGSFVRIAHPRTPAPGDAGPEFARDLPDGDVAVRIRLATLIDLFGSEIHGGLDEAVGEIGRGAPPGGPDPAKILGGMVDGIRKLVDSADQLDLSVSLDGDMAHIRALMAMKEGSALASAPAAKGNLSSMAACVPGDFPLALLLEYDFEKIMEWIKPFMDAGLEAMPEAERAEFSAMMEKSMGIMKHLGNEMAFALRFADSGMQGVMVYSAKDPQAYLSESAAMAKDLAGGMASMGVEMTTEEVRSVAGHDVHGWRMKFDMAKMPGLPPGAPEEQVKIMQAAMESVLGKDGMRMEMAAVGDRVIGVLGGDDALLERTIAAAKSTSAPPAALAAALDRAGGNPKFLMYMDLRNFMKQIMDLATRIAPEKARDEIPQIPAGDPIPMAIDYSSEGRHYRVGFSLDFMGLMDMIVPLMSPR